MKPYLKQKVSEGATISAKDLEDLIKLNLGDKLVKEWRLYAADSDYYLPSYAAAETIIRQSRMKELANPSGTKLRGQSFDCDDFSLLLKARFAYAAYREPQKYQNRPYCFGIVWGLLPFPFPHSMNWLLTDEMEFYFIEPQRQEIIPLNQCQHYRYINFMMV
ncbi:MAG: lectin MOA-related protein [Desulfobacteraceae bacterium]|jgi:hypothetical protein|nr:lectin MOA-related protein [Desulfobacteraceae bacterium]